MKRSRCRPLSPTVRKKGAVFVELAISLPILLVLTLAGFEYSRFIGTKNRLTTICRDISVEVFKRCQGESSTSLTQTCLQTQTDEFYGAISARLPKTHHIIVKLFRASNPYSSTSPCPQDASHFRQSSPAPANLISRVSTNAGSVLADLCSGSGSFDPSHEVIVAVELNYNYEPVIDFLGYLLGFTLGSAYVGSVV
jgi:hypothetical protein